MEANHTMLPAERIERAILLIRGHKIMLDSDLAELYGVETRVLVQAVQRNKDRFPSDFMFQLTPEEFTHLRSQSVISNGPCPTQHPNDRQPKASAKGEAGYWAPTGSISSSSTTRGECMASHRPTALVRSPYAVRTGSLISRSRRASTSAGAI